MRKQVLSYAAARKRWKQAGKPKRSREEMEHILREVCQPCDHYQKIVSDVGRCRLCGCALNLGEKLNKLLWATEPCPAKRPRFVASVIIDDDGVARVNPKYNGAFAVDVKEQEETPRQRKRRIRNERKARREKRQKERALLGIQNDPVEWDPTNDQLNTYDRRSNLLATHPLRDLWRPHPGFLVCGGPSLNSIDKSLLQTRGLCTLGVNNAAAHAKTKAFVYSDPTEKFSGEMFLDPDTIVFAPQPKLKNQIRLKNPDGKFEFTPLRVRNCPNVWGFERKSEFEPSRFLKDSHAHWGGEFDGLQKILFTPYLGLRLLHYLGCKVIYLVGVDFNMQAGETGGYAFPQGRSKGAARSNNKHYQVVNECLKALRPVLEAAGVTVLNTNPDSHCSAFDYLPFEKAVEHAKALLPEPQALDGWYEKPKVSENPTDSSDAG